eukprot:1262745-Alexandrium_andersonii.AAC.1
MSASLVGSEMCIRDSARGAPRSARAKWAATHGHQRFLRCPGLARGLPPVSYTHLTLPTICSV